MIDTHAAILVDSNVLLDLLADPNPWTDWSAAQLKQLRMTRTLVINPIIYAEIAFRFSREDALNHILSGLKIHPLALPFSAAFLAAKCHKRYRDAGGTRTATLPDFFIGAHATVENLTLLTRDKSRYHSYFPQLLCMVP